MSKAFLALVLAVALVSGCGRGPDPVQQVGDVNKSMPGERADAPFVFVYVTPGHTLRDTPVRAGVLVAIWGDGTIIRAKSEAELGKAYIRGRLTGAQVNEVRGILGKSGVLESHEERGLICDADAEWLAVRWGKTVRTWAHTPGLEGTSEADATDPRISAIRTKLLGMMPADGVAEPGEKWMKYPHEWFR